MSVGNILIVDPDVQPTADGMQPSRGLLTDWELSKSRDELRARQQHRTVRDIKIDII